MKKLGFLLLALCVAACTGTTPQNGDWGDYEPNAAETTATPEYIASGFDYTDSEYIDTPGGDIVYFPDQTVLPVNIVAVLLPLTGPNMSLGMQIKHAIEIAFLQRQASDILVSFHDLSGTTDTKINTIQNVLSHNPDMVIGPIFADDAKLVRNLKPDELPVISFTSDNSALGRGVLSIGLMPNQSIETIVKQMSAKGYKRVLFLAPDNQSGYANAVSAIDSARTYGLDIRGLYYYMAGNTDSIKDTAERATLFNARKDANKRAKETLSNILVRETLTPSERTSVTSQLNAANKKDTIGDLPYDAVLFLGNAPDSKTLASFLRYYDLDGRKVKFFGTALWDSKILFNDVTLAGSEYSSLPASVSDFNRIYQDVEGVEPERISSMGYDAAMLSINALQSKRQLPHYLLNPSGYRRLDGLFRLRANGTNERAFEVMELTGAGAPSLKIPAVKNFLSPIYATPLPHNAKPSEFASNPSINLDDYVTIPANLKSKYKLGTFGGKYAIASQSYNVPDAAPVAILPEDDSEVFNTPEFQPYSIAPVTRTNIDEVTVTH